MRICLDVSQSVYEGTGSGRYVIELIKGLLRQPEAQEYVLFGAAFQKREILDSLGKEYAKLANANSLNQYYFPFPPKLFELLWNRLHYVPIENFVGKVDIYHSSDWTQAPAIAKKVTTVHDLIPFLFPEYVHPRIRQAHELRWKHIIQDNVEVIVDAESTKKDVIERFQLEASKIHVIPLACSDRFFEFGKKKMVNDVDFSNRQSETLSKFDLNAGSYLLAVGTLEPRKNLQRLVEAYSGLSSEIQKKYKLVIVGKKAWASELAHFDNVVLTGYVEEADLPYLYSGAKCFVMPSVYEGFGLPVLESMACATPVICSKTSSLPEIGGDAVHYIQDPTSTESVQAQLDNVLMKDDLELGVLAKKGYDRALSFSWDRTARETIEVYRNL